MGLWSALKVPAVALGTFAFAAYSIGAAFAADPYAALQGDPRFTRFVALIDQAGLQDEVRQTEQGTIFAPVNEAVEAALEDTAGGPALDWAAVVRRHMVSERIELVAGNTFELSVTARSGDTLLIVGTEDGILVEDSLILEQPLVGETFAVYAVDTVIIPVPQDSVGE